MNASHKTKASVLRRVLAALGDSFALLGGQIFYLAAEGFAVVTRNPTLLQEMKAVRKAARYYWRAKALRRRGRLEEAFQSTKAAFSALKEADRQETFLQMGGLVLVLLDRLAKETGRPDSIRSELTESLEVFRGMKRESERSHWALDRLVNWLEHRLSVKPNREQ